MRSWEIESIDAQAYYVILNIKYRKNHINFLLHYLEHFFSHMYTCMNVEADAKHFNLGGSLPNVHPKPTMENKEVNNIALNMSMYKNVVVEVVKKSNKTICTEVSKMRPGQYLP